MIRTNARDAEKQNESPFVSVNTLIQSKSRGINAIGSRIFPAQKNNNESNQLNQLYRPNKTGLPNNLKTGVENLSGFSLDNVRVHYNSDKTAQLQALAYTQGKDIHLAPGQERHLPHEAWHVVQQMQGRVRPTTQLSGLPVNNDTVLENEADEMGKKANLSGYHNESNRPSRLASINQNDNQSKSLGSPSYLPPVEAEDTGGFNSKDRPNKKVIQGKFGFEIELALALGWANENDAQKEKNNYTCPDNHVTKYPVAAKGDGFEVHIDHNNAVKGIVEDSHSIVELVTKPPIDESTESLEEVRGKVRKMVDFVNNAKSKTGNLTRRGELSEVNPILSTEVGDGYLFIGGEEKGGQQLDTGYMQSTYAVKIEKAPKLFQRLAEPKYNHSPLSRRSADFSHFLTESPGLFIKENKLLKAGWKLSKDRTTWISGWGENVGKEQIVPKTKEGLKPLMGLLALISNYLMVGKSIKKHPDNDLVKNHLGLLFYKSKLSNLRKGFDGASDWYLKDDDVREGIIDWIITKTGVNRYQGVVNEVSLDPLIFIWLEEVLTGKDDPLFNLCNNEYSQEIAPYPVGKTGAQSMGVVVESRKTAPPEGWKYKEGSPTVQNPSPLQNQCQRPVEDWISIAENLWQYLRVINDVETPEEIRSRIIEEWASKARRDPYMIAY